VAEDVVAEIRQLLQDVVAPNLKALTIKVDGIQKQMELSERSLRETSPIRERIASRRA
jgi:hypothetical protein